MKMKQSTEMSTLHALCTVDCFPYISLFSRVVPNVAQKSMRKIYRTMTIGREMSHFNNFEKNGELN